jgi:hypothetical protein
MVNNADGTGRPDHCVEPIVWVGDHVLTGGKQIRVWSCEGVEQAKPWP